MLTARRFIKAEFACNISRKVGSYHRGRGQTSGQFQQSVVTSAFSEDLFDLSADVPEVTEAGTDVSSPAYAADTTNFL